MKRSFMLLAIIFVIALIVTSCTSNQPEEASSGLSPTLTSEPGPTNPPPSPTVQQVDFEVTLMVGEMERSYLLHLPPDLREAVPAVFIFHGGTVSPKDMRLITQFDAIADQNNFVVVYPLGVEYTWNTGWEKGDSQNYALTQNVDDLGFIQQILIDLETYVQIDSKRIYAAGHSQGGMLVYRLACEMADTFAAIASVAGPHLAAECNPAQSVSILHIHGLKDTTVKYDGGGKKDFPRTEDSIDFWAMHNNCPEPGETRDEAGGFTRITYTSCQSGTSVELIKTDTGNHSWLKIGIPASEMIWDFFAAHPKP